MPKILSKKLVSIREAAQILSVSIDTLRRWDKKGILKSLRPNGKDRYFSIEELEKIKFSKPLTISQAAQELKISQSTLRRLDKKGLIKPEKTKNGERLYSKKALEDFLHSEYFLRQKEVENEILQPLTEVENQISDNKTERAETSHKVIGAIINKTTNEVSNLNFSRKIFLGAAMFVFLIFIFTIIGIVVMFLARPIDTARFFGIASSWTALDPKHFFGNINFIFWKKFVFFGEFQAFFAVFREFTVFKTRFFVFTVSKVRNRIIDFFGFWS